MATIDKSSPIPAEALAELQRAVDDRINGVCDLQARRQARERMDRLREEFRRRNGEVNLAVELIREVRDES